MSRAVRQKTQKVLEFLDAENLSEVVSEQTYLNVTKLLKDMYDLESHTEDDARRDVVIYYTLNDPRFIHFGPPDVNVTCDEFFTILLTRALKEVTNVDEWLAELFTVYFSDGSLVGTEVPRLDTLRAMSETIFTTLPCMNTFMQRLEDSPSSKYKFFDPGLLTFALRHRPKLIMHFFEDGKFVGTEEEAEELLHFKTDLVRLEKWHGSVDAFRRVAYDHADEELKNDEKFRKALGIFGKRVLNAAPLTCDR